MKSIQVLSNHRELSSFEELESLPRSTGVLERKRRLHPVQMLEGLLASAGCSGGRLSDALRYQELRYSVRVNRSSFCKRLDETFCEVCSHGDATGDGLSNGVGAPVVSRQTGGFAFDTDNTILLRSGARCTKCRSIK